MAVRLHLPRVSSTCSQPNIQPRPFLAAHGQLRATPRLFVRPAIKSSTETILLLIQTQKHTHHRRPDKPLLQTHKDEAPLHPLRRHRCGNPSLRRLCTAHFRYITSLLPHLRYADLICRRRSRSSSSVPHSPAKHVRLKCLIPPRLGDRRSHGHQGASPAALYEHRH